MPNVVYHLPISAHRCTLHEPRGSGAVVPPAAGASRPRIRRGRDAREDSRDGCPTTDRFRFMVPMRANNGVGALHEPPLLFIAERRSLESGHSPLNALGDAQGVS